MKLPNIVLPGRRYFTTNDPVMTSELLDHFFNQRTQVFEGLGMRERIMLHAIYDLPEHQKMLPSIDTSEDSGLGEGGGKHLRQHQRYSLKCPGTFELKSPEGKTMVTKLQVVELSKFGFLAHARDELPTRMWGTASIQLGNAEESTVRAMAVRGKMHDGRGFYGFTLAEPDTAWRKFVGALTAGVTHEDLDNATRFLAD